MPINAVAPRFGALYLDKDSLVKNVGEEKYQDYQRRAESLGDKAIIDQLDNAGLDIAIVGRRTVQCDKEKGTCTDLGGALDALYFDKKTRQCVGFQGVTEDLPAFRGLPLLLGTALRNVVIKAADVVKPENHNEQAFLDTYAKGQSVYPRENPAS